MPLNGIMALYKFRIIIIMLEVQLMRTKCGNLGKSPVKVIRNPTWVYDVILSLHLDSAGQNLLHTQHHRLGTYGRRAFVNAGPSACNSLSWCWRTKCIGGGSYRQCAIQIYTLTLTLLRHYTSNMAVVTIIDRMTSTYGPTTLLAWFCTYEHRI